MEALLSAVFLGVVVGSIYSLTAYGLVLTYRTSGIFNFAHGALGMFFAFAYFQLTQGGRMNLVVMVYDQTWRLPPIVGLVLVVGILAPAVGLALDVVLFRRLRDAGAVVSIVATIGVLISLVGVAGVVWGAASSLTPRGIFSDRVLTFGAFRVTVQELATVALVLVIAFAVLAFLRVSRLGVRMRAVVDRPELSETMGVDARRVSGLAWAMAAGFAALGGILLAPFFGSLNALDLSFLVVTATAAAVVGRLESLPWTLVGGLGIGVTQFLVQRFTSTDVSRQLLPSIPFLVLFGALMLPIKWPAGRVAAPPPEPEAHAPSTPRQRATKAGIVVALLVLPAVVLGRQWQADFATVPPVALIFLSLVLLSGYGGQVSLCQAAFAGFGAFVAAHLVADAHWPFLLAVLVSGLATVPLGAVLAARAAGLPPLFLGLATLAFGAMMDEVAFQSQSFSGGLSGVRFQRPDFLASPRTYYLAGLALFALAAWLVTNLRRGRTGLAMVAMRDAPVGLASVGTSIARVKFLAFCTSAFLAGVGGAMLAGSFENATPLNYFKIFSLLFLALAVIGGISRWSGALVGAALAQLAAPLIAQPFVRDNWFAKSVLNGQLEALLPVFFGLGAIGLAQNPHGIVEQARSGFRAFKERGLGAADPPAHRRPAPAPAVESALVRFADASLYHRGSCVLAAGKHPLPVGAANGLRPCPICEPASPAAGNGSFAGGRPAAKARGISRASRGGRRP